MKIVQFSNGKFGIRRGWFFHEYKVLTARWLNNDWYSVEGNVLSYCQADAERVLVVYNQLLADKDKYSLKQKVIDVQELLSFIPSKQPPKNP